MFAYVFPPVRLMAHTTVQVHLDSDNPELAKTTPVPLSVADVDGQTYETAYRPTSLSRALFREISKSAISIMEKRDTKR